MKPRHTPPSTQLTPVESAKAVGLRYVNDEQPGVLRIKAGAGFRYADANGKTIHDDATLKRIRSLAIPPAWEDVWICPRDDGHLQATGRDAKGRKQFRYHPLWREVRDATKYDRMIEFGEALPRIRKRVARDMAKAGLSREKVLATIVRLIDLTFIRVGNDEYAKNNRSYGLTTMKDQHAKIRGERVEFSFRGKSGKYHAIAVEDARLARIVKNCQDIPGQELFQWVNGDGKRHDVTSGDVNDYLREISGTDFTAKDFRTWAGTVLAAQALKATREFHTQKQAKKNIKEAIDAVAEKLGNTPSVCRKCYVHPFVLSGYMEKKLPCNGALAAPLENGAIKASKRPATSLGCDEDAVLDFLRCCRREEQRKARELAPKLSKVPAAWRPRLSPGMKARRR
jgi:DNA topoisomerase I